MVRLKLDGKVDYIVGQTCFNSTMVRLKPIIELWLYVEGFCFNSTMVRLKLGAMVVVMLK